MSELRKDPLLGRWVAVIGNSRPPSEYKLPPEEIAETSCALCIGREKETPQEIAAIRDNMKWMVRTIPNFEPVFKIEGELGRKGLGIYDKMNGIGANELIIESSEHNRSAEETGPGQMLRVIEMYKNRMSDLKKDARLRYILIFKNSGKGSGAVFSHPHSELAATPIIPKRIKEELDGAKQYYAYKERCIFCDIIREELNYGTRIIHETRDFVAFSPFAPKFPFEFWIFPKRHCCAFEDINAGEAEDLSNMLTLAINKMKKALNTPPYNYVIHTAPNMIPRRNHWHTLGDDFHWHVEIMPRLIRTSGFEWGAGFYILTTSPEDASKYLREA